MRPKVLIIGKTPPPIGGVTVHVTRYLYELNNVYPDKFHFIQLTNTNLLKLLISIPQFAVIHLHTSNTYLQLLTAIYCKLIQTPLIITYHGNIGRYGKLRSKIELLSIRFSTIPLVQNNESAEIALSVNTAIRVLSTFITPHNIRPLSNKIILEIRELRIKYKNIFCTNAWSVTYDKFGNETYGISELIEYANHFKHSVLIISDPSGQYQMLKKAISPHVYWISIPHDFCSVLKLSDAFIRNSTTDATCISIHEALSLNKIVFASNCVSRPKECMIYNQLDQISLELMLEQNIEKKEEAYKINNYSLNVNEIIVLYEKLIQ